MPSHKTPTVGPNERIFYTAGFDKVITLPADAVVQMPAKCQAKRLVLCAFFDAAKPHHSCPLKKKCNFVHADVKRATQSQLVHINYAWHTPEAVTYDRFPEGINLEVAPPGCKHIVDAMDSSLALKTKALGSTRLPLQHCAHYYYTRQCDLGSDCMFVHAVYVDTDAAPNQRAPVPRDMGRGRDHLVSKASPKEEEGVAPHAAAAPMTAAPMTTAPPMSDETLRRVSPSTEHSDVAVHHEREGSFESDITLDHSCSSSCSSTAATASTVPITGLRYRHDPYTFSGTTLLLAHAH